jgi:hypothetical protein
MYKFVTFGTILTNDLAATYILENCEFLFPQTRKHPEGSHRSITILYSIWTPAKRSQKKACGYDDGYSLGRRNDVTVKRSD